MDSALIIYWLEILIKAIVTISDSRCNEHELLKNQLNGKSHHGTAYFMNIFYMGGGGAVG